LKIVTIPWMPIATLTGSIWHGANFYNGIVMLCAKWNCLATMLAGEGISVGEILPCGLVAGAT